MNIAFCCDQNYLFMASIMLTSFLENNKKEFHKLYFLFDEIEENNIKELETYISKNYKAKLIPIQINSKKFQNLVLCKYFTKAIYYRFILQEVIYEEKCLYLDCDIIINQMIDELYYSNISDCFAMVALDSDINRGEILSASLNLKTKIETYFNSGVMLLNLKKIRENKDVLNYIEVLKQIEHLAIYPDQDVLNILYNGKVKYCNKEKYNKMVYSSQYLTKEELLNLTNTTAILHYTGSIKPWHYRFNSGIKSIYKNYEKIYIEKSGNIDYLKKIYNWKYRFWYCFHPRNIGWRIKNVRYLLKME